MPIAEQVAVGGLTGVAGAYSVSETGVLAYQSGIVASRLVWFDRSGMQLGVLGDEADYDDVQLSPDETRVGVTMSDQTTGTTDLWLFDVARGVRTRFTFDPAVDRWPVWSPDGGQIIFGSNRNARNALYQKRSDGAGPEEELAADPGEAIPMDWSSDGRLLVYNSAQRAGPGLSVLALSGDRKPFLFMDERFVETAGRLSPMGDGSRTSLTNPGDSRCTSRRFPSLAASGRFRPAAATGPGGGATGRRSFTWRRTTH